MEFTKALHKKDFRGLDTRMVRHFKPIQIEEGIYLSIQASYGYCCKPAETLDDLTEYTHWEVALFDKDDNFVRVKHIIPNFKSLAEIELHFEETVYNFVPADLVEDLYLELKDL